MGLTYLTYNRGESENEMKATFTKSDDERVIFRSFENVEVITIIDNKNDNHIMSWQLIDKDDVEIVLRRDIWQLHFIES